jgi:hypothetical protein
VLYAEKLQTIFQDLENMESLMWSRTSCLLYFFYADRVFKGLDAKQTVELGWYLPRKNNRMSIDWTLYSRS